jgi:hypothetical protein
MKPEYHEAWFHCPLPPERLPAAFGVVTACNPFGRLLPADENGRRTEALRRRLDDLGVSSFPVAGGSRDANHLEPGFGLGALSREQVRELGREFEQDAVFWVEAGRVLLVPCGPGEAVPWGNWRARWIECA